MSAIRKVVSLSITGRRQSEGVRSHLARTLFVVLVIFGCAALIPAKSFAIGSCNPDIQVCS